VHFGQQAPGGVIPRHPFWGSFGQFTAPFAAQYGRPLCPMNPEDTHGPG